ncbi:hypothetical protein PFICI_09570 [Pestalotiopsis fici W106-1]|uniref:PLD phosphodiesterase domain-containing protein n=1 Tax=Pestalotiopsis fici (strain W106-1 / CGMCC3.15140) TaxID=1229662 RepID=W3X2U8_PESFW|nr:uncharacterized protein PFICI_09570 [Pestalotiopsis fici W106-1]ETS79717.1 hypothetical protein PFICI_09570 [Pestalotiopsis fici W106-1]
MGPLGALIDPWKLALHESSEERRNELPAYQGNSGVESLITSSNPQSFELGTGASIYTNSLLPAILKARFEVILVTCFWASSATLTALKETLEQLAEQRRQLVQGGGPDASTLPQLRIRICFSSRSLFQKLFHTTSRNGYVYPSETWEGTLGLPSPDLLKAGCIDLQVKSLFFLPFSVMHPKFLVVDRERAWLPSCNISWESWLEGCVEFTGDAVQKLMTFYRDVWEQELDLQHSSLRDNVFHSILTLQAGGATTLGLRTIQSPARHFASFEGPAVPTVLLPSSHHQNPRFRPLPWLDHPVPPSTPLNAAILRLIGMAERSIYMQTPNLTSTAVMNSLLDALERGVQVSIVTSKGMMLLEQIVTSGTTTALCLRSLVRQYNRLSDSRAKPRSITSASSAEPMIDLEAGRQRIGPLKISYFHANPENARTKATEEPVHSHLKLTIVDSQYTVLGSGNMDRASWFTSQELGMLFHSADFAKTVSDTVVTGLAGRTRTIFDARPNNG